MLAIGLLAPACCRSPLDAPTPGDPDAPWWRRLADRFRCGEPGNIVGPVAGAAPVAQPVAPAYHAISPPGAIAVTTPDGAPHSVTPDADAGQQNPPPTPQPRSHHHRH